MLHEIVGAQENSSFAFLNILDFLFFVFFLLFWSVVGWINGPMDTEGQLVFSLASTKRKIEIEIFNVFPGLRETALTKLCLKKQDFSKNANLILVFINLVWEIKKLTSLKRKYQTTNLCIK